MSWFRKSKGRHRYYLLPGMGRKSLRSKRKMMLQWGIPAGLVASALIALALYLVNRMHW